jgi:hypothetical protein
MHVRNPVRINIQEAGSTREKKGWGGGTEVLSQYVINNAAAVQQEN